MNEDQHKELMRVVDRVLMVVTVVTAAYFTIQILRVVI